MNASDFPFEALPASPAFVIVVSGPSGVGKTVICEKLIEADPALVRSVTVTTRPPRAHEKDGRDYHFWTEKRFQEGIRAGHFLEWAEVHGHHYGTCREDIGNHLRAGRSPMLNIDVQGGNSVKRALPEALLVFIAPPSMKALEDRLRGRGTDADDVIRTRLENAVGELGHWADYDFVVENDDLDTAVAEVHEIIRAERRRVERVRRVLEERKGTGADR